jgi:hypothetical protein
MAGAGARISRASAASPDGCQPPERLQQRGTMAFRCGRRVIFVRRLARRDGRLFGSRMKSGHAPIPPTPSEMTLRAVLRIALSHVSSPGLTGRPSNPGSAGVTGSPLSRGRHTHIRFHSNGTRSSGNPGAVRGPRGYWIAGSLCLHARKLDYLAPLLGFVGDKLAEVARRAP